jgi:signal transduction histidine kinase
MRRRPSRRQSLPAAGVARLCRQFHRELLQIRSSLDVPETLDRMMAALAHAGRMEGIAVILADDGRSSSIIGGWQIPHDMGMDPLARACPPEAVVGLDGQRRLRLATVATNLEGDSKLYLAAYARRLPPDASRISLWLGVALPLVALAVRQAQQDLTQTQSSVMLEAEVEHRTREVQRLSASERELLDQLRRQTAQLQAANAELRQLDETKSGIISSVSHELRTPISTIKTLARLLGHPKLPPHKHAQYLDVINAECDRQMSLVNDLLELARLEAGTAQPQRNWHDLVDIVKLVADRLKEPIEAAGQQLIINLPDGLDCHVWGHPSELEQIVSNLLSNAHKFTDAGGQITISIEPNPQAVSLSVTDTGIGIAAGQIDRIFDIFYRVPHPERPCTGTGVGLAIVRRLVDNLGGTLNVDSREGVGTRFSVTWPRR